MIPKFDEKHQFTYPMNPKLKKQKQQRDPHPGTYNQTVENLPDFKTYYITLYQSRQCNIGIRTDVYNKERMQSKKTPKLHIYGELICDRGAKRFQLGKEDFFNKSETTGQPYLYPSFQKIVDTLPYSMHKINSNGSQSKI